MSPSVSPSSLQLLQGWLATDPPAIWLLLAFVGACVGSFLNVVIHRLPLDESVVTPRSRCPTCRTVIAWYDNLPVLSYLLLRGRCRHCRTGFSARYLVVELVCAGLALAIVRQHGWTGASLALFVFAASLVAITFIDLDHYIIPNEITWPGMVLGLLFSQVSLSEARWGFATGFGGLYALAWSYEMVRRREGLGMGDVKLMGMVGVFLGWKAVLFTIFVGSLSGVAAGLVAFGLEALGGGAAVAPDPDAEGVPEGVGAGEGDGAHGPAVDDGPGAVRDERTDAGQAREEGASEDEDDHDDEEAEPSSLGQLKIPFGPFLAFGALAWILGFQHVLAGTPIVFFQLLAS